MYEAFFGLKRRPFAATPDPQCFLASGTIQAALDEIVVCVEQGQGIAVVSAPAGTGKTLLCERLRSELGDRFESVLLRHASFLTRRALLQTILCELNHSYRQQDEQELRLELSPAIRALRPQREALVLICDEAHQLSEELLEELRILSDLAEHGRPLVRLVLVGQLRLEETLALSSLEALSQRIRAHVCLETMNRAGSLDYIDYRLTWAGGRTDEIFTTEALELVSRAADGVPRCINQLCDHALLLAYVAEQQPVPAEMIREALQDLRQLPLHWNESSLGDPVHRQAASLETEVDCESRLLQDQSCEVRRSTGTNFEMESIEIGADLLPANHPHVESSMDQTNSEAESDSSVFELTTEAPTSDRLPDARDANHESIQGETMTETPVWIETYSCQESSCWDVAVAASMIVPLAPMVFAARRSHVPGGFVEELVVDRYAAIDAGLEPPQSTTLGMALSAEVPSAAHTESQTMSEINVPGAEHTPNSISFEAQPAAELKPPVFVQSAWESGPEPGEIRTNADFDDAMEDQLGSDVCQLADQLQQTLGLPTHENSPVEQLRSLISPIRNEDVPAADEDGPDAVLAIESNSTITIETSPTSIDRTAPIRETTRPYRNLFSLLRRKQQGLL
jgi:general secretion pathway protein A